MNRNMNQEPECAFKNCPLCKARDDFINQLNVDLMQDVLPLSEGPLEPEVLTLLTQDDLDCDLDWDANESNL
jgi:hypothetical protein